MSVTFFYVFAGEKLTASEENWAGDLSFPSESRNKNPESLDNRLIGSFKRLENERDLKIVYNPTDYDRIRNIFEIKRLPAFGVSDIDLEHESNKILEKPPKPPHRLNPFAIKKRKRMLAASKYFPKVDRPILEFFDEEEKIFFFIRDLHILNKDHGLNQVIKGINKALNEKAGKKAKDIVDEVKRKFLGG